MRWRQTWRTDVTTIRDERSIPQLLGDSLSELTKLVQNEIELARVEIVEKLSIGTGGAKLIAAGVIFLTPGIVLILLALAAELAALGTRSAASLPVFGGARLDNRRRFGLGGRFAALSERA